MPKFCRCMKGYSLLMSHGVTIRLVNKLGEGHDDEVIEWKKSLITSHMNI